MRHVAPEGQPASYAKLLIPLTDGVFLHTNLVETFGGQLQ